MSALRRERAAEVTRLPGHDVIHGLTEMIRLEVARQIQAAGVGEHVPTLAEYRARAGLSVSELALLAQVSKSTVTAYERGVVKYPKHHTLDKLARALQIEPSAFRMAAMHARKAGA